MGLRPSNKGTGKRIAKIDRNNGSSVKPQRSSPTSRCCPGPPPLPSTSAFPPLVSLRGAQPPRRRPVSRDSRRAHRERFFPAADGQACYLPTVRWSALPARPPEYGQARRACPSTAMHNVNPSLAMLHNLPFPRADPNFPQPMKHRPIARANGVLTQIATNDEVRLRDESDTRDSSMGNACPCPNLSTVTPGAADV
ncbi:hypothetical protein B0H19DRAFT_1366225 [Mycena capillaripes]|nr:hypothetical protein B0H19DRAFT_1366225 [Mycena capillaripes]